MPVALYVAHNVTFLVMPHDDEDARQPDEQAVLVCIPLSDKNFGSPEERQKVRDLEKQLEQALTHANTGEFAIGRDVRRQPVPPLRRATPGRGAWCCTTARCPAASVKGSPVLIRALWETK